MLRNSIIGNTYKALGDAIVSDPNIQTNVDEKDLKTTAALLRFCGERTYRGHIGCPCGSGKKLRDCHGTVLFPIMTDSRKQEIVINDLERIRSVLSQYESTGKNNETSK